MSLILHAFMPKADWPIEFVKVYCHGISHVSLMRYFKVYMDDNFGDRVWIEDEYSRTFVDNILTGFGYKPPQTVYLYVIFVRN